MSLEGDEVSLAPGDGQPAPAAERQRLEARLQAALDETAAYRAYFRQAEAAALIR